METMIAPALTATALIAGLFYGLYEIQHHHPGDADAGSLARPQGMPEGLPPDR
jgi:hypothetical protein